MDRRLLSFIGIRLSVLTSVLWIVYIIGNKIEIDIETVLWDYGLIFVIMGIAMVSVLKKYSNDIITNLQGIIRKDILRPFLLLPEDVDNAVEKGNDIYIEGPERSEFYTMEDVTINGSTVESILTGDRFSYRGDIKNDLKGLITDGFHVYLKQAYDEMLSCGFELYKY